MNKFLDSEHFRFHYFPSVMTFLGGNAETVHGIPFVCGNPDCRILHVELQPPAPEGAGFEFDFAEKRWSSFLLSIAESALIPENLTERDWAAIERYARELNRPDVSPFSDAELRESLSGNAKDVLVPYHTAFPFSGVIEDDRLDALPDDQPLNRLVVYDNYCVNLQCKCTEANLQVYRPDSGFVDARTPLVVLRVDVNSGKTDVDLKRGKWNAELKPEKLMEYLVSAQPQLVSRLAERRERIRTKIAGLFSPVSSPSSVSYLSASSPLGIKIGRNEKCRCGSGRKFKYCCGI